jgi:fructose-1,6-bisphosphatase II / sedoheptulose-1,7-bisphosphatase
VIFTTMPEETGIDIYLGIGAAPEGVIAAGALRCIGGQMQGRLVLDTEEKRERAKKMGVDDPEKKYNVDELARGDVVVAATGVTDGALLAGVKFGSEIIETDTLVYRSATGTVRRIKAEHRNRAKFHLES